MSLRGIPTYIIELWTTFADVVLWRYCFGRTATTRKKGGGVLASFSALSFDWADECSVDYGVFLIEFGLPSAPTTESAGGNFTIVSENVPRCAEQLIYGVDQDKVQQFVITVGSDEEKSRADIDRILGWLLRPKPERLVIDQDDMEPYFYCGFFSNPQLITIDNRAFGLTMQFNSISPYGYTFPRTIEYDIKRPQTILFNNTGDSLEYFRPTLTFKPTNITDYLSIINLDDNGREFRFDFDPPPNGGETITIDSKRQIITSSMGGDFSRFRLKNFTGYKWFRLIRGQNRLKIVGNGTLTIEYSFPRRIGN